MPTIISHAITSLPINLGLLGKINTKRIMILSIIFGLLPDIDGIGFFFGVKYGSFLGHRGFSHSFFFIIIATVIFCFLAVPKIKIKSKKFLILFANFFSIGSLHIFLDMMTNGGLGLAIFSPITNQRFFLPWQPIEVSSILPQHFLELNGLAVIKFELLFLILPAIALSVVFYRKWKMME